MTDNIQSFSREFPEADESMWRALVEKALKGGSPEKLNSRTYNDFPIKGLYRNTDSATDADPAGMPGVFPFVRGNEAVNDAYLPWDIRQIIAHPCPSRANEDLLKDLEGGVSSIELRIDEDGERGVCVRTQDDLRKTLSGMDLNLAGLGIDTTGASSSQGLACAAQLAVYAADEKAAESALAFNLDPIGVFARVGETSGSLQCQIQDVASFARDASSDFPHASFIRIDARPVHEAGGSEAQELAFLMAEAAAYMRALLDAGLNANDASRMLLFTMSVGADHLLEVAKLRAARHMWSQIAQAFGCSKDASGMRLQAISSRRMLAARDPWVNMLRNTASCFSAGVGGADIVTVRPFTDALGLPSKLARRIARNTQILAQEEANLGKVSDPAGGAWSFSRLTEDLAGESWALFQSVEAEGGIMTSLQAGTLQTMVATTRLERVRDHAFRKKQITGVSDFPILDQEKVEIESVDLEAILASASPPKGVAPDDNSFGALRASVRAGATLSDLTPDIESEAECDAFWPIRLSSPYEALRDHADSFAARKGNAPKVFIAALGPLAEHSARVTFAQNFFAAGGITTVVNSSEPDALGKAFEASDCVLACICGSDPRYAEQAADAARALGAAGAGRLYLAGKPGESEAAWREAGVDEFIHVGVNVVASLELAHSELGLTI